MIRVRVVVEGRVQGVFYRQGCQRAATSNGVAGWIRNNRDGTVEAALEGEPAAVNQVVAWMRVGSPRALVTRVVTSTEEPTGEQWFRVR